MNPIVHITIVPDVPAILVTRVHWLRNEYPYKCYLNITSASRARMERFFTLLQDRPEWDLVEDPARTRARTLFTPYAYKKLHGAEQAADPF